MPSKTFTRRGFLQSGAAAGLLWSSGVGASAQLPIARNGDPEARNIILLVADGMNTGTWTVADYYQQHQTQRRTEWVKLYQEEEVALMVSSIE